VYVGVDRNPISTSEQLKLTILHARRLYLLLILCFLAATLGMICKDLTSPTAHQESCKKFAFLILGKTDFFDQD
jgi:hypothetical protein